MDIEVISNIDWPESEVSNPAEVIIYVVGFFELALDVYLYCCNHLH